MIQFSQLPGITHGKILQFVNDELILHLITDSRKVAAPGKSLFFAIRGSRHDGHDHISSLYEQGVRSFVVEKDFRFHDFPLASFIQVDSSVDALQNIVAQHRTKFSYPVLGITGSNGKTIVKEWLYQMIASEYNCVKNPGSYNSQIGVPLSVWQMSNTNDFGIFEAGVSRPGEMAKLAEIIQPTIGIFTNIGTAHDEGFTSRSEKIREKLKLFEGCETVIFSTDYPELADAWRELKQSAQKSLSWGRKEGSNVLLEFTNVDLVLFKGVLGEHQFHLPFKDPASVENILHCIIVLLYLGYPTAEIQEKIGHLKEIPMRMQLKQGINQCQIVDDTYNNDLGALRIGLEFLDSLHSPKKTLILSDILQSGLSLEELQDQVAALINEKSIQKFVGIGFGLHSHHQSIERLQIEKSFHLTTDDFLRDANWDSFDREAILVKGARVFEFEKIVQRLEKKIHGTIMEIDLGALVNNLNFFRSLLNPGVKMMVMVKAFAYGSGSNEIASLLQYHRVDYLGVAYADEGVALRRARIKIPIMVMNPSEDSFQTLLDFDLEPEIYSIGLLRSWVDFLNGRNCQIHLKIDTGMHRLGFDADDLESAIDLLSRNTNIKVVSIFSHLAGADDADHDAFTALQTSRFEKALAAISQKLSISPLAHLLNSSGILRHPNLQFSMVRLGIGLYGIDPSGKFGQRLKPVASLKTVISQIKRIPKGESVGYGRAESVGKESLIATLAIGYADGFSRVLSRGVGEVVIRGQRAPVIGNVCMDMTMVDITNIPGVEEGDPVTVFGQELSIIEVATKAGTIPYEILTNTSERVKRVFFAESI